MPILLCVEMMKVSFLDNCTWWELILPAFQLDALVLLEANETKAWGTSIFSYICTSRLAGVCHCSSPHQGVDLKKHKDTCIKGFTDRSALAEHAWTEDHPICWDDTRIQQHAIRTMELVVKEAICIRTTPESSHFNHDCGYTTFPTAVSSRTGRLEVEPAQAIRLA